MEVVWIDDREDPNHRPHHIFRCIINLENASELHVLAKENEHHEGQIIELLHKTEFSQFLPKFYGIFEDAEHDYILMEDLNYGFKFPCHIDIKIGTRQWDIDTSEKYYRSLIGQCNVSTSHSIGIRLVSATILDHEGNLIEDSTKSKNMRLSESELKRKIKTLIPFEAKQVCHQRLQEIVCGYKSFLHQYPRFRVYASSVLICYDAEEPGKLCRCVMIDFAHAHLDIGAEGINPRDPRFKDGVLMGLKNLTSFFE